MQLLRFQNHNIFVIEKSVQFLGKTIARSKKKVKWVIKHGEDKHQITCCISFYSGKKKATHNGHTIMDIVDSRECLDLVVTIGFQRMIFTVDEDSEQARIERRYNENNGSFLKFKNIYSQPVSKIYQKFYGQ